jgi:dTDP-4-dehydrorhamnose 3,5-epimerase
MKFTETELPGVVIVEPRVFGDDRGFFMETYHSEKFAAGGISAPFVQDNHSRSVKGVLRGLHYQEPRAQGKLVRAINGAIFDVAVDIRRDSPAFGKWVGVILSDENRLQLWVPPGFAHGFQVISELADVAYKCTELYDPAGDRSILWSDPAIGIEWPIAEPVLSSKDAIAPTLAAATSRR